MNDIKREMQERKELLKKKEMKKGMQNIRVKFLYSDFYFYIL